MKEDFLTLLNIDITEEEMFYLKLKDISDDLFEFTYWLKEIKKKYPSAIINPYEVVGKKLHKVIDRSLRGIDYSTATSCYIQQINVLYHPIVYFGIGLNNIYNFERIHKNSMFFEDLKDAKEYINNEFR